MATRDYRVAMGGELCLSCGIGHYQGYSMRTRTNPCDNCGESIKATLTKGELELITKVRDAAMKFRGVAKVTMQNIQYRATIDKMILNYGRHLQAVFGTSDQPGPMFVYTIGNALKGLPELIFVGNVEAAQIAGIMNMLSDAMAVADKAYPEGLNTHPLFKLPFKIHYCSEAVKKTHTIQATNYLGRDDYVVHQILICDAMQRFAPDPETEAPFNVTLL